jgi:hypothetical protein
MKNGEYLHFYLEAFLMKISINILSIIMFYIFVLANIINFLPDQALADELLTRSEAVTVLIEQVINSSDNKDTLMAFGPQEMLLSEDVVEPFHIGGEMYPGNSHTIDRLTWFFWINDEPDARFVHQTRFVYIDASHADPTIEDGIDIEIQGWWPKINGIDFYSDLPGNSHPDLVYGTLPLP